MKKIFYYLKAFPWEYLWMFGIIVSAVTVLSLSLQVKEVTISLDQNKIIYKGEMKNNKMNGFGTLTFEDGSLYKGYFVNGLFDGKGVFISSKGWMYEGEFKEGKAEGKGIFTTETKTIYDGSFKQGIFQK